MPAIERRDTEQSGEKIGRVIILILGSLLTLGLVAYLFCRILAPARRRTNSPASNMSSVRVHHQNGHPHLHVHGRRRHRSKKQKSKHGQCSHSRPIYAFERVGPGHAVPEIIDASGAANPPLPDFADGPVPEVVLQPIIDLGAVPQVSVVSSVAQQPILVVDELASVEVVRRKAKKRKAKEQGCCAAFFGKPKPKPRRKGTIRIVQMGEYAPSAGGGGRRTVTPRTPIYQEIIQGF